MYTHIGIYIYKLIDVFTIINDLLDISMDFYGAMATLGFFNVTFGCMDQDLCEMHPFQIYSNSFPKSSSPSPFFEKKLAWQTAINKPEKKKKHFPSKKLRCGAPSRVRSL